MAIIELHTVRTGNGGPEIVEHWNALLRGSGEPRIPYIELTFGADEIILRPVHAKRVRVLGEDLLRIADTLDGMPPSDGTTTTRSEP